jgi:hypothetical protein
VFDKPGRAPSRPLLAAVIWHGEWHAARQVARMALNLWWSSDGDERYWMEVTDRPVLGRGSTRTVRADDSIPDAAGAAGSGP